MAYKYPPNCLDEVNYCCFNQLSLSEDEAKGSSSEENILMGENLDITKYKAKNIRRPQRCVLERLETSDSVADLFPNLQSSLLMWSNPQKYTIKRSSSLYGLTYKGPWMFSQTVFVKQLLRYDLGARQAVLHELEMSDKFQSISPKLLAFAPYEQSIRIAFEYMPLDLPKLMETRLEINFNIPSELARIMGEVSDQGYLLREFRLEKFVGREVRQHKYKCDEQKIHQLFVVGVHEMWDEEKAKADWMTTVNTSCLPSIREPYSKHLEKYLFAQILTRITLSLKPQESLPPLPGEKLGLGCTVYKHDFRALRLAKNLECRNNLLRIVTLYYLVKSPSDRPPYELVMVWPCSWPNKKFLQFLIRFFELAKTKHLQAKYQCARFESEVIPDGWISEAKLGDAYQIICEAIAKNDPSCKSWVAGHNYDYVMAEEDFETIAGIIRQEGLYGMYRQFRNREAHAFELSRTFKVIGHLSVGYVNFWRQKFPMMMSAAYLIAINMNFHKNPSFKEFFEADDQYYEFFKNKSVDGHEI